MKYEFHMKFLHNSLVLIVTTNRPDGPRLAPGWPLGGPWVAPGWPHLPLAFAALINVSKPFITAGFRSSKYWATSPGRQAQKTHFAKLLGVSAGFHMNGNSHIKSERNLPFHVKISWKFISKWMI